MLNRLNEYRVMWIIVLFDLPTDTKEHRRDAARFRKDVMGDGFTMFQYSVYVRQCASMDHAKVHINRVRSMMPVHGRISVFCITDKQYAETLVFYNREKKEATDSTTYQQLEMF